MSETKLLVFVPNPAMGHLASTVEFAKLLVEQSSYLKILVLIFHVPIFNSPTVVESIIESQSHEVDPNRITFLYLPPLENPPDTSNPTYFYDIFELQKPLVKKVVDDQNKTPIAFVLDMLCFPMMDVANEFKVPSYFYFASGTSFLTLLFHAQSLVDDEGVDVFSEYSSPDGELEVPNFENKLPAVCLPWFGVDRDDRGTVWRKFVLNMSRSFRKSEGIIINTFMELESSIIQSLQNVYKGKTNTIYTVGPVLHLRTTHNQSQEFVIQWLDQQPSSSVVFLCFGSKGSFDIDQVKEIANGLDRSGCKFLWSLRTASQLESSTDEHDIFEKDLPEGFLDKIAHKGKVIGWAPQVQVLAHRAIGGFVTHCGWNSILESLWFGVPMATWPIYAEQQLNAFVLVKELSLATEISLEYRRDFTMKGTFLVTAEEVEDGVKRLMNLNEEMRGRVREMRDKSRMALENGGSSHQSLTRFVEDMLDNERRVEKA